MIGSQIGSQLLPTGIQWDGEESSTSLLRDRSSVQARKGKRRSKTLMGSPFIIRPQFKMCIHLEQGLFYRIFDPDDSYLHL